MKAPPWGEEKKKEKNKQTQQQTLFPKPEVKWKCF